MSNSLLTDSIITKEALMALKNHLGFTKRINRQYDKNFAVDGAKKGATINIRKPSRYEVTDGAVLNIQDTADKYEALTLDKQKHVGLAFSSKDLTLSVDEFRKRYIDNAVIALANQVDSDCLAMYKNVYHSVGVPSASAYPSSLKGFTQGKAKIAHAGGPKGIYNAAVNPDVESSLVNGLNGLFHSAEQIKKQYEDGTMGRAAGCDFFMSQNIPMHTVGALGGTPLMNGSTAAGATTLVTDGWTNSTGALKAGDVITVGSVYAVNPQTRQSTGQLAQFTVVSDATADGSGNMTITIDRAIYASGQYQNVNALPADGAAILTFGHASSYAGIICPQNLVFHKDAFVLGCADLELPKGVHMSARASDDESGLSIRLVSDYDITNDRFISRLDILYGVKCVYPDLACRVVGQPA